MYTVLLTVHFIVCILMVIVVLLQSGKGGGLGTGFGGGSSNTLFGSSGGSNFFTKFTMGLAIVFAITSISLTSIKNKSLKSSIFDQTKPIAASAAPNVPVTPPVDAPIAPVAAPGAPATAVPTPPAAKPAPAPSASH
jgi:preprotein translocase subunit SecG